MRAVVIVVVQARRRKERLRLSREDLREKFLRRRRPTAKSQWDDALRAPWYKDRPVRGACLERVPGPSRKEAA